MGPSRSVTQMMSLGNSLVAEIPFLVSVVELILFCPESRFYCDTNNAQYLIIIIAFIYEVLTNEID